MSLFILDTDTVTLASYRHPQVTARIQQAQQTDDVTVCVITVREIMEGWIAASTRSAQPQRILAAYEGLRRSTEYFAEFDIIPFTPAALARFDALVKSRLNVRNDDLRIAAIALEAGAIVVTRNLRDFRRVPGLICEDWSV